VKPAPGHRHRRLVQDRGEDDLTTDQYTDAVMRACA
jgi:hypothetical protein